MSLVTRSVLITSGPSMWRIGCTRVVAVTFSSLPFPMVSRARTVAMLVSCPSPSISCMAPSRDNASLRLRMAMESERSASSKFSVPLNM